MPRGRPCKKVQANNASSSDENPVEPYNQQSLKEVEHYNLQKLIYIYYNWDKLGNDVGKAFVNGQIVDNITFKTIVEKLIIDCKTTDRMWPYCDREVEYRQNSTLKQGRFISKNFALINMARPVRHTVAEGLYQDLDVVNCHLYIYQYLCKLNGLECPQIDYYISNRDKCLLDAVDLNSLTGKVSKDDVKQWYLMILNGGKGNTVKDLTLHMQSYQKELEVLHTKLSQEVLKENPEYKDYLIKRDGANVFNLDCKIVSKKLEDYENRMRHYICEFVKSKGCDFSSHCYDGGMSYLPNNADDIKKLINTQECSKYVMAKTGITCPLKWKDFDLMINIPKEELDKITIADYMDIKRQNCNDYQAVKYRFEKHNFFVEEQVLYYYDNDNKVIAYKKDMFIQKYEDITYEYTDEEGQIKIDAFIYKWIKDSKKRRYSSVVWRPSSVIHQPSVPAGAYNLWKGFEVEKIEPDGGDYTEQVNTILNHFKYLVNHTDDSNEETKAFYKYFLNWNARLYQYPSFKSEVCIGLKSLIQGAGKTTMFDLHTAIMGRNLTAKIENPERDMFGDFNALLSNRIFILLEECDANVMTKYNKRFLDAITATVDNVNGKNKELDTKESYTNYMAVWNTYGLKVPKEDRRTWCMEICAEQAPSRAYFIKLFEAIKNPQVQRAFYDYLMKVPLIEYDENGNITHKYHPADDRPETELRKQMVIQQRDKLELWISEITVEWYRYVEGYEPYIPDYNYLKLPNITQVDTDGNTRKDERKGWLTSDMFTHFTNWLKAYRYVYHVDLSTFGKRLKSMKNEGLTIYTSGGKSKIALTVSKSVKWGLDNGLITQEHLTQEGLLQEEDF
jgi:hypothetical protein